jgi:phosphoribosyl 1,2-cyclic phosphate phosphodiesterase
MQLFFLGTAAAEGYPGIFCNCASCQQARALGGRNLRYRSSLLVNDDLLIDCGADLLAAAQRFNRSLWGIRTCLVTHAHSDHFYTGNFGMRGDHFTGGLPVPHLDLYGPREVIAQLAADFPDQSEVHIASHAVHALDRWENGGYTFTALRARHALERLEALFYSVDDGQHAFLYATDTGRFPDDSWQALQGRSFDVIVLEETMGHGTYDQHLGFVSFLEQARCLREAGMLRPGGRLIAHHFSHSGNPPYEDLVNFFAPHNVEVAYDGMEINLHA